MRDGWDVYQQARQPPWSTALPQVAAQQRSCSPQPRLVLLGLEQQLVQRSVRHRARKLRRSEAGVAPGWVWVDGSSSGKEVPAWQLDKPQQPAYRSPPSDRRRTEWT